MDAPISDSIKPLPSFIICRDLKSCLPTSRESASCRPACITALAPALWTNGPTCTLAALRRTFRWGNRLDTSVDTFYYRIRTCTPPTFYTYSLVLITFRAPHIPPHRWLPHPSLARMPLDQQYLESLYWAVSVTTGLGNDIVAGNATEVLFTSVIVVFGLIIYSILLGSATSALQNKDSAAADKRNKLDRVGDYLRYRKVPVFFQKVRALQIDMFIGSTIEIQHRNSL